MYNWTIKRNKERIPLKHYESIFYTREQLDIPGEKPANCKIDLKKHRKWGIDRQAHSNQRREQKLLQIQALKDHIIGVSREMDRKNSSKAAF